MSNEIYFSSIPRNTARGKALCQRYNTTHELTNTQTLHLPYPPTLYQTTNLPNPPPRTPKHPRPRAQLTPLFHLPLGNITRHLPQNRALRMRHER